MFPVLFSIGSIHFYSFSVFLIVAWCVFSFLFWKLMRANAIPEERIFDLTFYGTLTAFVFSRMVFVLFHPSLFQKDILRVFTLWIQPGLSFPGALFGGVLALILLTRSYKIRVGYVLDSLAIPFLGAFMVGAVGVMLDGSEVGRVTKLAWAVRYVGHVGSRHPIGIYEIVIFAILTVVVWFFQKRALRRQWPYGIVGIWFFFLLSLALFGLEFLKDTSVSWKSLTANQWVYLGIIAESLGAFYVRGGGKQATRVFMRKILTRFAR